MALYVNEGFPIANAIKRQAIGDRDALKYNEDGSLDLYTALLYRIPKIIIGENRTFRGHGRIRPVTRSHR